MNVNYHYEFSRPVDNSISGSSEVFRHNEFQVTQMGFGGDFNHKNVQARLMTQFGRQHGDPGTPVMGWSPDLANTENRLTWAMLVKY